MTYALPPDVTVTRTERGMVLLQETTGRYWMLNGTGAAVLELLTEGRTVPSVIEELGARFGQDPERVGVGVRRLLEQLSDARLVRS